MPQRNKTVFDRIQALERIRILSRGDLLAAGLSSHAITRAVRSGELIRIRQGVYVSEEIQHEVSTAVRIGGRVTCLTLLRLIGIFVLAESALHVHVDPHLSRSKGRRPDHATLHWGICTEEGLPHAVSIWDAVRQSVRCQTPRAAVATLDSLLHHRVLTHEHLAAIFGELPARFQAILALVDASAESGPETLIRLILRSLGLKFQTQVVVHGVGRVDFLVDGWLIIECDSREFHEGWSKQVEDRTRDLAAARRGYVTIRPLATDVFTKQGEVRDAIRAVVEVFGSRLGSQDVRTPEN